MTEGVQPDARRAVMLYCTYEGCTRAVEGWHDERGTLHMAHAEKILNTGWFFAVNFRACAATGLQIVDAWCPSHMQLAPAAVGMRPANPKL